MKSENVPIPYIFYMWNGTWNLLRERTDWTFGKTTKKQDIMMTSEPIKTLQQEFIS